jgi:hypothetical protein
MLESHRLHFHPLFELLACFHRDCIFVVLALNVLKLPQGFEFIL